MDTMQRMRGLLEKGDWEQLWKEMIMTPAEDLRGDFLREVGEAISRAVREEGQARERPERRKQMVACVVCLRELDPPWADELLDLLDPIPWPMDWPDGEGKTLNGHLREHFGPDPAFLQEPESRIPLALFPPLPNRPWRTAVTLNLGAVPMQVPGNLAWDAPRRVELVMRLPLEGEDLGPLGAAARAVLQVRERGDWLVPGTLIPVDLPDSPFHALLVESLREEEQEASRCPLPRGGEIVLLEAFWLSPEERRFCATDERTGELWDRLCAGGVAADPGRPCLCPEVMPEEEEKRRLRQAKGMMRDLPLTSAQLILTVPETQRTYDLNLTLGESLCQRLPKEKVNEAEVVVRFLESMGRTALLDPDWMYQMSCASLYAGHLGDARYWLERAESRGCRRWDLAATRRRVDDMTGQIPEHVTLYSFREEQELLEKLSERLGPLERDCTIGQRLPLTVCRSVGEEKPWYTLVTLGMGQAEFPVSGSREGERVELVVTLPQVWNPKDGWLKREGYPLAQALLAFYESVLQGDHIQAGWWCDLGNMGYPPFPFEGLLLVPLPRVMGEESQVTLSSGRKVNLLRLLPLLPREARCIRSQGGEILQSQLQEVEPGLELVRPLAPVAAGEEEAGG